jgi:hypothetical protein
MRLGIYLRLASVFYLRLGRLDACKHAKTSFCDHCDEKNLVCSSLPCLRKNVALSEIKNRGFCCIAHF